MSAHLAAPGNRGGLFFVSDKLLEVFRATYTDTLFYLRTFKNFAAAELDLDQSATLLIGPNGSGKSNLSEAVELLSFLSGGHRLHEVTDIGREGAMEVRGGLEACARIGSDEFTLGIKTEVILPGTVLPTPSQYEITVRVRPEPRIGGESLKQTGRNLAIFEIQPQESDTPATDNQVQYDNNDRGGKNRLNPSPPTVQPLHSIQDLPYGTNSCRRRWP